MVKNLYSCGCYAYGPISALSRCSKHNGYIIVAFNYDVTREVFKHKGLTLIAEKFDDQMEKFKPNQFHWIMCYPEHNVLYSYNYVPMTAWLDVELSLFKHLRRLLAPGGYVTLIVDMTTLHTCMYQAKLQGFSVKVRKHITFQFDPELLSPIPHSYTALKACVMLYVDEVDMPDEYKILDCSGIHFDHTLRRAGNNPICVTTSNRRVFDAIKARYT